MASFVEEATLRLNDEASKNADKINDAMERMEKTAKSLKKALSGFNFDMGDIAKGVKNAEGDLDKLEATARRVKTAINGMRLSFGKINTAAAHQSIATLIKSAQLIDGRQKLNINTSDLDYGITRLRSLVTDLRLLNQTYRINIDTSSITSANTELRTLHGLLGQPLAARPIEVNATELSAALRELRELRRNASNPINIGGNITGGREQYSGLRRAIHEGFSDGVRDIRQALGLTFDQIVDKARDAGIDISKGETDLAVKYGVGSKPFIDQLKVLATQGNREYNDVSIGAIMRTFGDVLPNMKSAEDAMAAARDIPRQLAILNQKYGPDTKAAQNAAVEFNKSLILLRAIGTDARSVSIRDRLLQQSQLSGLDVTESQVKRWMQGIPTAMLQAMNAEMVTTLISGGEEQQQRYIQGARMLFEGFTNNNIAKKYMDAQQLADWTEFVKTPEAQEAVRAQKRVGLRDKNGLVIDSELFGRDQFEWVQRYLKPVVEKDLAAMGKSLETSNPVEVQNVLGRYLTASRSRLAAAYLTEADFIRNERRKVQRVNLDLAATNDSLGKSMLRVRSSFESVAGTMIMQAQPQIADASRIAANAMSKLAAGEGLTSTEAAAASSVLLTTLAASALSSDDPTAQAIGAAAAVIGVAGYMFQDAIGGFIDGVAKLTGTQTVRQALREEARLLPDLIKAASPEDRPALEQRLKELIDTENTSKRVDRENALADALKTDAEFKKQQALAESKQGYVDEFLMGYYGRFTDKSPAETADAISRMLGNVQDQTIGPDDLRAFGVKTIQELQRKLGVTPDGVVGDQTVSAIGRSGWVKTVVEQAATVAAQTKVATMTTDQIKPVSASDQAALAARAEAESTIAQTVTAGAQAFQALISGDISGITTVAGAATAQIESSIGLAGGTIETALTAGAGAVANAIRAALSTPVNLNVNTNNGARPVDTGASRFTGGPR